MKIRFETVAAISAIVGLLPVGCTPHPKIEYDVNQPRNWVKFYENSRSQSSWLIDTVSIKSIRKGVQYDLMFKRPKEYTEEVAVIISTHALNCKNGTETTVKSIWLDANGMVKRYDHYRNPSFSRYSSINGNELNAQRAVCRRVGAEPKF